MPELAQPQTPQNVLAVLQRGRIEYEAVIFAASFRAANPDFAGRLIFAEPQPGARWPGDPRAADQEVRRLLTEEFGAEIRPFENRAFGASYPNGNKIEGLSVLPEGESFFFFDTDTLFLAPLAALPLSFDRPSASLRRTATWPVIELYGPGYTQTWKSLYDHFGLDFESSLDLSQPEEYWERYLYFNAGWFYHACGQRFHRRFLDFATQIRDAPTPALVCQPLDPWLDQVALPLVIHSFGGGRDPGLSALLDDQITCHYRWLPLLYARERDTVIETLETVTAPNRIKKVLKGSQAVRRLIYHGKGRDARALVAEHGQPSTERALRNLLKREKLWLREP